MGGPAPHLRGTLCPQYRIPSGCLEKAGFQLEGILRHGICKRGRVYDACMYALLVEDM